MRCYCRLLLGLALLLWPALSTTLPVAWWKFDDNTGTVASDATGNGHTITLNSGAAWGPPGVGVAALRCTGAAISPDTADMVFDTPLYSWEVWIRSDTDPSNTQFYAPVANGPTNVGTDAWALWWGAVESPSTTRVPSIMHRDSVGEHNLKIPGTIVAHTWYHIAATFDGTTVRLYVNGQPQGTMTVGAPASPTGPPQVCGRYFPDPWAGDLDEFYIIDRTLTPAEVLAEYQRGATNASHVPHKTIPQ